MYLFSNHDITLFLFFFPDWTHQPSSAIGGHVTVHLHGAAAVVVDIDGVHSTGQVAILHVLSAVHRERVRNTHCAGVKGILYFLNDRLSNISKLNAVFRITDTL